MITMSKFICIVRLAALIIAASLLSACSAVKLAYNQAPDLTYWWLDGYFDFNDQQTPKVRDELTKLFAWHRSSELPKTADLLAQAAQLASGDITAGQACRLYEQGRALVDNVTNQALPALAALAPTVTPDQIDHLKRKYAKNAEEFKRDFVNASAANREARRLKQSVDRSEMLYGKLEDAQIAVIKQMLADSSFNAQASIKERERRQRELIDLLTSLSAAKASPASSEHALRVYFQRVWESPDPAYRASVQRMTAQACQSFASIHASTTPAQRANAVKVLKGYETDLRALAANK
jgi:Family of unknown function (DUF6279)